MKILQESLKVADRALCCISRLSLWLCQDAWKQVCSLSKFFLFSYLIGSWANTNDPSSHTLEAVLKVLNRIRIYSFLINIIQIQLFIAFEYMQKILCTYFDWNFNYLFLSLKAWHQSKKFYFIFSLINF